MTNFKNITELPVTETVDGLKLIVNDDGAAKQIAIDEAINNTCVNLPIADVTEASVLCIENGEMKQMPMNLGGNTEYDIVVRLVGTRDAETNDMSVAAEILSGSFDAVVQKLDAGIMPLALVIENGQGFDDREIKTVCENVPVWNKWPDEEPYLYIEGYTFYGLLYADGTYEFD